MDFCGQNDGNAGAGFVSSVISSGGGGPDPTIAGWGAQKLNLSFSDVQETIMEGRTVGFGVWNILGNTSMGTT